MLPPENRFSLVWDAAWPVGFLKASVILMHEVSLEAPELNDFAKSFDLSELQFLLR